MWGRVMGLLTLPGRGGPGDSASASDTAGGAGEGHVPAVGVGQVNELAGMSYMRGVVFPAVPDWNDGR